MKHIIIIMFFVAMGFKGVAQNNTTIDPEKVDDLKTKLDKQVVTPLRSIADKLASDIDNAQSLLNILKDRKFSFTSPVSSGEDELEGYLASFPTLKEMFEDNSKNEGSVKEQIDNFDTSDLKTLYLLIFDMKQSLAEPYDESSNNRFIKEAANNNALLPQHKKEFDELVSQINDYNYYMFELGRLFVAADEDKYRKKIDQLVKDEDAEYLLDVPYTSKMLKLYIDNRGELDETEKAELKNACSDAFPDF